MFFYSSSSCYWSSLQSFSYTKLNRATYFSWEPWQKQPLYIVLSSLKTIVSNYLLSIQKEHKQKVDKKKTLTNEACNKQAEIRRTAMRRRKHRHKMKLAAEEKAPTTFKQIIGELKCLGWFIADFCKVVWLYKHNVGFTSYRLLRHNFEHLKCFRCI